MTGQGQRCELEIGSGVCNLEGTQKKKCDSPNFKEEFWKGERKDKEIEREGRRENNLI
jgi:hypothetical protein